MHADALACVQTLWCGWGQMVSEMKQTEKKPQRRTCWPADVNVARDALAWLGTHLPPCGHADVARDVPATCKRACRAGDVFACTWTRWPMGGHVDAFTYLWTCLLASGRVDVVEMRLLAYRRIDRPANGRAG